MRLFFAVTLPDELIEKISEAQARLRAAVGDEGVRWTRPDQFHYTLKFLGETPAPRAYKAVDAARAVCEGQQPFAITLGGAGAFPSDQRPSVLWIGATAGAEPLIDLAVRLDKALVRQGFPRENRPPKAHLTLARIKTYAGEAAAARALKTVQIGEIGTAVVGGIVLMQSALKPTGSEYTIVEKFGFVS
jgi:2'-5' RNA ligase